MFAIGLDLGSTTLKLAFAEVSDNRLAKPAVTQVLPAGAGRLSDLPLRMGKADGDTDAAIMNAHGETWNADVDLDVAPGAASRAPDNLTVVSDRLLFTADDGRHGRGLWVSDGKATGRRMVADPMPGSQGASPSC